MSTNTFWSAPARGRLIEADGRSEEANPLSSASREQHPRQREQNDAVVPVTTADILPSANLRPPTAQTFEELGIPASFREAVEKELTRDEKMLWVGRPSDNPQVQSVKPIPPWIGPSLLILAAVIFVVVLGSAIGARPMKLGGGQAVGCFFAVALGLFGSVLMIPRLFKTANACRYCYVVTNRRALLVETSVWKRGAGVQSYLPQQLLGLERRDHASVAGAGDLIFEYILTLPGNSFNLKTGSFLQQGAGVGLSNSPQRVPRGFMGIDQVRDVEGLIRTTLLSQFGQALDAPMSAATNPDALRRPAMAVACPCGATLSAAPTLSGKSVKCPRCAAAVALPAPAVDAEAASDPVSCREDGAVPADVKEKLLKGLDANEKPVWIGQPIPALILARGGLYFAVGGFGILAALIWLSGALTPAKAPPPHLPLGKRAPAVPASQAANNLLPPAGLFLASMCVSAVPLLRWRNAKRTCYMLTNRRALVYQESLFGSSRDSYSPLEVSNMRRGDSWLAAGSGDLIFRSVQVVSSTRSRSGGFSSRVKTINYGFLAIAQVREAEKLVRETLIDHFVDKLTQASAL